MGKRNMRKYTIREIVNSGRKGLRGTPVEDAKYNGLTGSIIEALDIEEQGILLQFKPITFFTIETKSCYDWWTTSEIIAVRAFDDFNKFWIETVNTMYLLEKYNDCWTI